MPTSIHSAQSMKNANSIASEMNKKIEGILPYKKATATTPSATINTYGTAVDLEYLTNGVGILLEHLEIVYASVGTETVSAQATVTYTDNATANIVKTATEASTVTLTAAEIMGLVKDGVHIKKISVRSKSSIAESTATATFNHWGLQL